MGIINYQVEIDKLAIEIESLPKGYISKKNINGKTRYYLQWVENGKIRSRYLKDGQLEELSSAIERRRELQNRLKMYKEALINRKPSSRIKAYTLYELKEKYGERVYELIDEFRCVQVPALERYLRENCWRMYKPYIVFDESKEVIVGYFTLTTSSMVVPLEEDGFIEENDDKKYANHIIPCVEIEHFAVNDRYREICANSGGDNHGIGQMIFKRHILGILNQLNHLINFTLVTLHAFNNPNVIEAYRRMGFMTMQDDKEQIVPMLSDAKALYTEYSNGCVFMFMDYEAMQLMGKEN